MTMHSVPTYLSWILLCASVALWAGVGYFMWAISAGESARAAQALDLTQESVQYETVLRFHAAARDTRDERAQLESIAHVSVIEILDSIEAVGRDLGVDLTIGEVLPTSPQGLRSSLNTISLVVDAKGTFTEVAQVAALLESLSVPSVLGEVGFERLPSSAASSRPSGASWHMVARMQFMTTADVSS